MTDSNRQDVWLGLCSGVMMCVHVCPQMCIWACVDVCAPINLYYFSKRSYTD